MIHLNQHIVCQVLPVKFRLWMLVFFFLAGACIHCTRITHLLTSAVNPTATLQSGYSIINETYFDTFKANSKCIHEELSKSACFCPDSWRYVVLNQTGGFRFPMNRPCPSTPQSLTPKMMQLRFGANSPRPSSFYSPSSNPLQHFRCVMILCISQECLICSLKYLSAKVSEYQVYLWLGSLVHPSRVYKTLHWPDIYTFPGINVCIYTVKLEKWIAVLSGDKRCSCTYPKQILHVKDKAEY